MMNLFGVLLGSLLIARVGPVRLLAGLVAVPIMSAIVVAAAGAAWIAWHVHGGSP